MTGAGMKRNLPRRTQRARRAEGNGEFGDRGRPRKRGGATQDAVIVRAWGAAVLRPYTDWVTLRARWRNEKTPAGMPALPLKTR